MDEARARALLDAERARVVDLLEGTIGAAMLDRSAANEPGDSTDRADELTAVEIDEAVSAGLRERLAAIDRAGKRLAEGSYGRSVLSGLPIPDERLEADPAAELTVAEASRERI